MIIRRVFSKGSLALVMMVAIVALVGTIMAGTFRGASNPGMASAAVTGNPVGATSRYLVMEGQTVRQVNYVTSGAKTMANTTPVVSDPECGLFGTQHRADVHLVGTMSGTAPTLTIKWQNSIDGGTTWQDVGTWTEINATSVATLQSNVVSDLPLGIVIPFTTPATMVPKAYGDCWRASYTFGGTGTVTANFEIVGLEK